MLDYFFEDDIVRARLIIIPDDLLILSNAADQCGVRMEIGGSPNVNLALDNAKLYTAHLTHGHVKAIEENHMVWMH